MFKQFTLFLVPLVMALLTYGENTVDVNATKAIPADPFEEAIDWFKLQDRNGFTFIPNTEAPYSGWAKKTYDNGQFEILAKFENGLITKAQKWQENGLPIWEAEYIPNKNGAAKFINVESEVPIIEGKPQFGTQTKKEWKENPFIGEFPNYEECNGTVKEWFANGQKSWEGEMKDGLDHGLSTEWFENGVKAKETNWLAGTKNGISRSWNENGQITKISTYQEGEELNKTTFSYFENGQLSELIEYKGELQNGETSYWYENGQKSSEGYYKDGNPHGETKAWYENGQFMGKDFFDEGKFISSITFLPNGEKCPKTNLVNGNGTVCYYYDNGQKSYEENFKEGLKHGPNVGWHENGSIEENATYSDGEELSATRFEYYSSGQVLRMTEYKNGRKDGAYKEWKMNGDIEKEAVFKNGKEINSTIYFYFKNREKKSISNFKNSKKNGVTLKWNENGQLEENATYLDDQIVHGVQIEWHENGQKSKEINYIDGVIQGVVINWHQNGQKKLEVNYEHGMKNGISHSWSANGQIEAVVLWENNKALKSLKGFGFLPPPHTDSGQNFISFDLLTNFNYHVNWREHGKTFDKHAFEKRVPKDVRVLDGTYVSLTGFMVPTIVNDENKATEFLLMPDLTSSLLGIPPESNGWVVVDAEKGINPKMERLIRVSGVLNVREKWDDDFFTGLYHLNLEKFEFSTHNTD